jgi:hypothetical protein
LLNPGAVGSKVLAPLGPGETEGEGKNTPAPGP